MNELPTARPETDSQGAASVALRIAVIDNDSGFLQVLD
jgi:hypothetical protein